MFDLFRNRTRRQRKTEGKVADLEAKVAALERTLRVKDAEIDALAAVIARDRERVAAETAVYARRAAVEDQTNGRIIGDIKTLRQETHAWDQASNKKQRGVNWQFKIDDARVKLKSLYPKILA